MKKQFEYRLSHLKYGFVSYEAIYRYDLLFSAFKHIVCFPSRDDEILPPAASPGDWLEVMWPCVWFRDRQAKQGEKLCSQI